MTDTGKRRHVGRTVRSWQSQARCAALVAAGSVLMAVGCSKSYAPPAPVDAQWMQLYDGSSCDSLEESYVEHETVFHEINDNLAGNAAKNVAKIMGFGVFAFADGDLSGDKRRNARDTHLEHMEYVSSAGAKNECANFPKTIPTERND